MVSSEHSTVVLQQEIASTVQDWSLWVPLKTLSKVGELEMAQKRASGHLAPVSHHAPSSVTFCVTNSFMYQDIIKAQGWKFQKEINSKRTEGKKKMLP